MDERWDIKLHQDIPCEDDTTLGMYDNDLWVEWRWVSLLNPVSPTFTPAYKH